LSYAAIPFFGLQRYKRPLFLQILFTNKEIKHLWNIMNV